MNFGVFFWAGWGAFGFLFWFWFLLCKNFTKTFQYRYRSKDLLFCWWEYKNQGVPFASGMTLQRERGFLSEIFTCEGSLGPLHNQTGLLHEVSFSIRSSVSGLQDLDKTLPTEKAETVNLLSTSQSLTPYRKHFGTR